MSAAASWSVRRVGNDRLRVEAAAESELVAWIRRHDSVVSVAVAPPDALEVVVGEEGAVAGLARALKDRLFAAGRRRPRAFAVSVAHALSGRVRLRVDGLEDRDVERLAEWLRSKPGVRRARPSPASASIVVWFDPRETSGAALVHEITTSDRSAWPSATPEPSGWGRAVANTAVLATCVAAPGLVPSPLLGAAVAATATPSVFRAAAALRERHVGIDALDVVAIGISVATGRFATAALVTWLLGLGDLVLARTHARARAAITDRLDLRAIEAYRLRGDALERVAASLLRPGDRIVAEIGTRVPADGTVESGVALVDEKALTGESIPRGKRTGDRVLSASVVVEGRMVVRVEKTGSDTTAMRIAEVLANAGAKPMTLQRKAERAADRLVLPTFALAGVAGALTGQLERTTSVLITDFGTGLRIAVPTGALAAMTIAAREGVLIKGGQFLERLARVDTIVFDKTGTLTRGEPEIVATDVLGPLCLREAIALAAAAEARQRHPIAKAIRRHAARVGAGRRRAEIGSEAVSIGRGVSARVEGRHVVVGGRRAMLDHSIPYEAAREAVARHRSLGASTVFVAVDGRIMAALAVSDAPRPESAEVIGALRAGGRREVVLLSGDASEVVQAIGRALAVDRAEGELLPDDKVEVIRELQEQGRTVAMVGDGMNDAPALVVADVGISLQGGTELALEAADVLLLEAGLSKLPRAFAIAAAGMANIERSMGVVLAPNALAIVLGAAGLLPPGLAAIVNNGSTVAAALAALAPLIGHRGRP